MIKMIAAVSQNGVIGQDNKIPFDYPEDLKFFRKMTLDSTVIMGRKTFEGIGKPLAKRNNIVVTSREIPNVYTHSSLNDAINAALAFNQDIWLIGGSLVYREGMNYAEEIYLTLTPDIITGEGLVFFPWIDPTKFEVKEYIQLENSKLQIAKYIRVS